MIQCRVCGEAKAHDAYYASSKSRCKECTKEAARQYRAANLESVREYDRNRGLLPSRKTAVKARAHRYKDSHKRSIERYKSECPERRKAHIAVGAAIKRGILKVKPCQRCGFAFGVQAHHEDYSRPLDVTWLCTKCHGERHREINAERRAAGKAA